ncbi:MAG: hypothetical protein R6U37_04170 [Dehalococcoidia bacterium]
MRDIRIHNSSQADALRRRFDLGSTSLDRKPVGLPLAMPRGNPAGQESPVVMRAETSPYPEDSAGVRNVDPEVIADMVYRLMRKDLVLERERQC